MPENITVNITTPQAGTAVNIGSGYPSAADALSYGHPQVLTITQAAQAAANLQQVYVGTPTNHAATHLQVVLTGSGGSSLTIRRKLPCALVSEVYVDTETSFEIQLNDDAQLFISLQGDEFGQVDNDAINYLSNIQATIETSFPGLFEFVASGNQNVLTSSDSPGTYEYFPDGTPGWKGRKAINEFNEVYICTKDDLTTNQDGWVRVNGEHITYLRNEQVSGTRQGGSYVVDAEENSVVTCAENSIYYVENIGSADVEFIDANEHIYAIVSAQKKAVFSTFKNYGINANLESSVLMWPITGFIPSSGEANVSTNITLTGRLRGPNQVATADDDYMTRLLGDARYGRLLFATGSINTNVVTPTTQNVCSVTLPPGTYRMIVGAHTRNNEASGTQLHRFQIVPVGGSVLYDCDGQTIRHQENVSVYNYQNRSGSTGADFSCTGTGTAPNFGLSGLRFFGYITVTVQSIIQAHFSINTTAPSVNTTGTVRMLFEKVA